jgi:hypothetical protein
MLQQQNTNKKMICFILDDACTLVHGRSPLDLTTTRQRRFEGLPTSIKKVLLLQKSTEPQ